MTGIPLDTDDAIDSDRRRFLGLAFVKAVIDADRL